MLWMTACRFRLTQSPTQQLHAHFVVDNWQIVNFERTQWIIIRLSAFAHIVFEDFFAWLHLQNVAQYTGKVNQTIAHYSGASDSACMGYLERQISDGFRVPSQSVYYSDPRQ